MKFALLLLLAFLFMAVMISVGILSGDPLIAFALGLIGGAPFGALAGAVAAERFL